MHVNLSDCVELPAQRFPEREAVVDVGLTLTFAQLLAYTGKVAAYLLATGLQPGERVVLLLPNTLHFPIIYHGLLRAGGVVIPLNPLQTAPELTYIFSDCRPRHVFVWESLAETARTARDAGAPDARLTVIEAGREPGDPGPDHSFLREMAGSKPITARVERAPEDVAVIMYTAAYAGFPMGAQLTHANVFQNAQTVADRSLHYTPDDRCLAALPLFHSFGQVVMMNAALLSGATVVLMARFDAGKTLELIAEQGITVAGFVPTMVHFLLAQKSDRSHDLSSLRLALAGGAAMPMAYFDAFRQRFGRTLLEGYGLTETSPAVSFNRSLEANRPGSVGLPIWGCDVAIVDEDNQPLPPGVVGEVIVRGPNVMKGYLNQPEATAATIRDGWLHTGDWGSLDEDGYLYLHGLKKDMLIRAGLNVYPREVERVLESHPAVREAAVVGTPDPVRGEEAVAFVVPEDPFEELEKELKAWCRQHLAGYKCPRHITFCDALPRNEHGTLNKGLLRTQAH